MTVAVAHSEACHHTTKPALLKKVVEAEKYLSPRGPKTEKAAGDVDVAETISQEHFSKPMDVIEEVVESVDVPMPQVAEEVVEVAQRIREHIAFEVSQERDQKRIAAQRVHILVPPVMEEISATDPRRNRGYESPSTSRAHKNMNPGTDRRLFSATAHRENRGSESAATSEAHTSMNQGTDCGLPSGKNQRTVEVPMPHVLKETVAAVTVVPFRTRATTDRRAKLQMYLNFGKKSSKLRDWSHVNVCNDGSTSKLWKCLSHKIQRRWCSGQLAS